MRWLVAPLRSISEQGPQYGANLRAVPPSGKGIRYVRITDIDDLGQLRPDSLVEPDGNDFENYLLSDGDLLLARSGATVGKSYRHVSENGQCAFAGYLIRFRLNSCVANSRYLSYYLQTSTYWNWVQAKKHVAAQPNISGAEYASLPVPLPPLREQHRIVEILDEADRLRRLRREADAKAARILPALFLKMFGDPATNPMRWPMLRFDEIADARLGKMLDSKRQTGEHRRPYLRNQNVQWDFFKLDDVLDMDFLPHERAEFELRVGDLLICEGGEVGRAAIWDGQISECYFQKALHRVRPHPDKATPEFLLYWLWAMARCQSLMSLNSKATIPHLTGVQLAALRIICPPFQNQQDFARLVSNYRRSELRRQEAARGIESLFQILLQRAFSGQLTAKWREAHTKELLAEMEQQARLLNLPLPLTF
ncbi:MAG: restriction endonuclease subunit S [Candidatus Contendobacter sp.]